MQTYFDKTLEQIKNNDTSLNSLELWVKDIGPAGAKDLASALVKNTSLNSLGLRGNQIGPAGAKDLAGALKNNYSLLELKGVNNEEISSCLKRNKKIAQCLTPLNEAIKKGHLLNDFETIE